MQHATCSRRAALRRLAAAAMAPVVGACWPPRATESRTSGLRGRRLASVLVARERVIRHVVGLRPFRPSGFKVSVDRLGEKVVIHNYGHGGGGISLSWGTAHLALQHAVATPHRDAAVLGCGAVGLATARLLQDQGFTVTIYARDLPPHTTSNTAGATWGPVTIADDERRTPAFDDQFVRAARYAFRYFQTLVSSRYGVTWRDAYILSDDAPFSPGPISALLADIRPPMVAVEPGGHPFGRLHVTRTLLMHIEPSIYLPAVLTDYRIAGGRVLVRELRDVKAVAELPHPVVVNCTGLGAAALFGDEEMLPIKGQLTVLAPQHEVDYITVGPDDLYMMPRQDGIILGGTHERGEWSMEPNPAAIARILDGHRRLFESMR